MVLGHVVHVPLAGNKENERMVLEKKKMELYVCMVVIH